MTTTKIINRELEVFHKLNNLNQTNITINFESIRKNANDNVINLHKLICIVDNILKHSVGVKYNIGTYSKIKGKITNNFHCNVPANAYPLFKTHNMKK